MSVDVVDLLEFYATPLGGAVRRLVGRAIHRFWPRPHGLRVLGLGYATPFLKSFREPCERTLAMMPAQQGVVGWPRGRPSLACLSDPLMLPLPDACLDRVLVAHALETTESPSELLHEVWRVLAPGGRAILVVPNRRGIWARIDATPFGHGQPYSRRQLDRLVRKALFTPEGWAETLYMPPVRSRLVIETAAAWERVGTRLGLPFAGLHVVEASKQIHRPILVRQARRAERFAPVLVPRPVAT